MAAWKPVLVSGHPAEHLGTFCRKIKLRPDTARELQSYIQCDEFCDFAAARITVVAYTASMPENPPLKT